MASVTLIASGNTGLTGMTISSSYPITNAYDNSSDTSSYARYSISTSTTGYVYLTYDTSDIPATATIQSVAAKARLRISNTSRVTDRVCQLYTGTTAKGSNTDFSSTSSGGTVVNLSTGTSWTRSELNDLRMRIGGTGSSSTSSRYIYIYGTDITITYTTASRTVTTTLTGNGTIDPSGTQTMYDGDEYELIVEPTNALDTVTATKNGTAITLTQHQGGDTTESNVLGDYTLVSGGFNGSGASYFQRLVGKGHDNTQTTSNYYSSGSGTIAVFTYDVPFEGIPDNATIKSLYMLVNGHCENTSQSSEYMCVRLISGSTNLSDELNFKSVGTSNSTQTVTANVTPTISQLENLKVQCRLGYYGGAINGATVYLEYEVSGVWYTYSTTISGDMTIAVTIGNVTTYTINASSQVSRVTVTPATQSQAEGGTAEVRFDTNTLNNIIVKDNNVDVTSQLVSHTDSGSSGTKTYIPSSFDSTNSSYDSVYSTNIPENGLTSHTSTTRCCVYANTANGSESYLYYNFDCSDIPSNAIITSVSCQVGASCYSSGSYFSTHTLQLCTGTTEKGTAVTTTGNGSTSEIETVNGGSSWTRAELDDIKIRFKIVRSQTGDASFSFFGATLTVEYTVPGGTYWTYTLSNLQTNHTIVVISGGGSEVFLYIKEGGNWVEYSKVYKKVNGSWVEQASSTWSTLFNTNTNYRKME